MAKRDLKLAMLKDERTKLLREAKKIAEAIRSSNNGPQLSNDEAMIEIIGSGSRTADIVKRWKSMGRLTSPYVVLTRLVALGRLRRTKSLGRGSIYYLNGHDGNAK